MRLIIWAIIGFCALVGISHAGTISSYPNTNTLVNADLIPAIHTDTNYNINWYGLKELMSKNVNWTDIKMTTKSGGTGNTSGINWQDFGA